jgi:hypothetical protein
VVQVRATVTGANGGDKTAPCPAGYTLVSAALDSDARTSNGINGWDNGGNVGCGISGNTLTASLHNYQNGTPNTAVSCVGLCVR